MVVYWFYNALMLIVWIRSWLSDFPFLIPPGVRNVKCFVLEYFFPIFCVGKLDLSYICYFKVIFVGIFHSFYEFDDQCSDTARIDDGSNATASFYLMTLFITLALYLISCGLVSFFYVPHFWPFVDSNFWLDINYHYFTRLFSITKYRIWLIIGFWIGVARIY